MPRHQTHHQLLILQHLSSAPERHTRSSAAPDLGATAVVAPAQRHTPPLLPPLHHTQAAMVKIGPLEFKVESCECAGSMWLCLGASCGTRAFSPTHNSALTLALCQTAHTHICTHTKTDDAEEWAARQTSLPEPGRCADRIEDFFKVLSGGWNNSLEQHKAAWSTMVECLRSDQGWVAVGDGGWH